ncbi:type II secretion system protein [Aliivibrio salmonicida]|jgi:MSHA pilin protein MshA|uniref:Type IV pilus, mannose-sensitive hemagglutinin A n=1 Tax=Aliivibrio salmonicida (strain LFI1238) TaxID=316275 RepID=B6EM80_ALISL|nr:type II secretion system protein [Aliivibrio salmonicida]AZL83909.1 type II secretion system protein [Aliivibrio salmonicida]CAQ78161.1 type IV pilus, mannose-sensitive hemagglutinin A [Aliivibrio salmonicida LFI1238]
MKRQGGFTLIELVVVIVILGILAVTAAPKFLNLQGDARKSSLQGLKGAMAGASGIVYGKAAIEGVERGDASGDSKLADGTTLKYGYPTADNNGIESVVVGLAEDWSRASVSGASSLLVGFKVSGATETTIKATKCFVTYNEATASSAVTTLVTDDGC